MLDSDSECQDAGLLSGTGQCVVYSHCQASGGKPALDGVCYTVAQCASGNSVREPALDSV